MAAGVTDGTTVSLSELVSGQAFAAVVSADALPDVLPAGLVPRVLGRGERRSVVLGAPPGGLSGLTPGTAVAVDGGRGEALLRAYHRDLRPVSLGEAQIRILPLWPDPSAETQGEILERDSWLPGPGQGIPVLIAREGATILSSDTLAEDPAAAAVVRGERQIAASFPQAVVCVRGQGYQVGVRFQVLLLSSDGHRAIRGEAQGPLESMAAFVDGLIDHLSQRGGDQLR